LLSPSLVRGTIGQQISEREGDVDFYRVPPGPGPRALHARLQGIPGVDLVLELFDGKGERIAKSDSRGAGRGEWLQPTSIGSGEVYVSVREVRIEGTRPIANALDPYGLTARWGAPQRDWESEPNDSASMATPVTRGQRLRGYLGSAEDRDWFAIQFAGAKTLKAKVNAPRGVDVVVLRDEEGKRTVDRAAAGEDEELTLEADGGKPILVGVARKPSKKDPKEEDVEGLDEPYELTFEWPEE
jgi:hypothetical protein